MRTSKTGQNHSITEDRIIRTNFHSHTTRCNHAIGSDEDYVKSAIKAGYQQLGISDHSPFPDHMGQVSGMRMHVTEFPDYLASSRGLKAQYADQLDIFIGLEAEYYPQYHSWLIAQKEQEQLDFLILGSHYDDPVEQNYFGGITTPDMVRRYVRHTISGLETGDFCALAHPELFMISYPRFDKHCQAACRELIRAAKALQIPLEYNLSGLYTQPWRRGPGYPTPGFWEMVAEEGAKAIIGLDAHDPARYDDTHVYDQAVSDLTRMGIPLVKSLVPCARKHKQAI
ncbi:MAG: histidinol-phosphatase [Clostridiales bacterium]|nr:histidinol-phosphatase [Clostridiales bacterium]